MKRDEEQKKSRRFRNFMRKMFITFKEMKPQNGESSKRMCALTVKCNRMCKSLKIANGLLHLPLFLLAAFAHREGKFHKLESLQITHSLSLSFLSRISLARKAC